MLSGAHRGKDLPRAFEGFALEDKRVFQEPRAWTFSEKYHKIVFGCFSFEE